MNYLMLHQIIKYLEELNPGKARKLKRLLNAEKEETDPTKKKQIESKIHQFVYNVYMGSLARESRNDIYNTSMTINEDCYTLEQDANDGWYIFFDGAKRLQSTEDGIKVINHVPREYKQGFYLKEDFDAKEAAFLKKYHHMLDTISKNMDHKQELTTFDYQTKSPWIPVEFVELLVDFLGLTRIPQEEKKQQKS